MRSALLLFILALCLASAYFKFKHEGPILPAIIVHPQEHPKVKFSADPIVVIHSGMYEISNEIKLTQLGHDTFIGTNPQYIEDKSEMNNLCSTHHSSASVLGCYYKDKNQIVILKIQEPSLRNGILTTAAHETLHAIYASMTGEPKAQLKANLKLAINMNYDFLNDRMKSYKLKSEDSYLDEVHAILGTEVANLPRALESHYLKFFRDRALLTQKAASFKAQFDKRLALIQTYDQQILDIQENIKLQKLDIDQLISSYKQQVALANKAKDSHDVDTYNSLVPDLNRLQETIQRHNENLNEKVRSYNDLLRTRNAFAEESNKFASAIDTSGSGPE